MKIKRKLSEIRLEQMQRIESMENPDEANVVQVLLEVPNEVFFYIKRKDIVGFNQDWQEFINGVHPFKRTFHLNGVHYGFIPNLSEINGDEYAALKNIGNTWENMHKLMAVLYRPITAKIGKYYRIKPFNPLETNYSTMQSMPIVITLGALQFMDNVLEDVVEISGQKIEKQVLELLNKIK